MKNKHNFAKALLATVTALFFIMATATAQCVIPIAPGQSYIEDFQSGEMECCILPRPCAKPYTAYLPRNSCS